MYNVSHLPYSDELFKRKHKAAPPIQLGNHLPELAGIAAFELECKRQAIKMQTYFVIAVLLFAAAIML